MFSILLRNLRYQPSTGCYIAIEAGYSYRFSKELMNKLRTYLSENPGGLIADWYRQLAKIERDKIEKRLAYS